MELESQNSILYSDILVPDIFIAEYLPSADGDYIKVYLYCQFLVKYGKRFTIEELSKKLELDSVRIKDALIYWESLGVLVRKDTKCFFCDLKEKEIRKMYRMKPTSTPEEALFSSERNKKRNEILKVISNSFFQGLMPPPWYTDIDSWFDRYKFEEDVMYALFKHCYDHKGLAKSYIVKVADSWYSKGIRNSFDLDSYFIEYQKFNEIKNSIRKKLKLSRNLTEYEEEYIEKWILDYKYDMQIIDLALKKTTSKTNPNFNYIHKIITDWYNKGLRTEADILAYDETYTNRSSKSDKIQSVPGYKKFEQHEYDEDYFDKLVDNIAK